MVFLLDFMSPGMYKIGCVNYARFPESGHILWLLYHTYYSHNLLKNHPYEGIH